MKLAEFLAVVRAELGASRQLTVLARIDANPLEPERTRYEWWPTIPDAQAEHSIKFVPPRSGFAEIASANRFKLIGWMDGNKGEAQVTLAEITADDGTLARAKGGEILRQFPR